MKQNVTETLGNGLAKVEIEDTNGKGGATNGFHHKSDEDDAEENE